MGNSKLEVDEAEFLSLIIFGPHLTGSEGSHDASTTRSIKARPHKVFWTFVTDLCCARFPSQIMRNLAHLLSFLLE
jgi:hypothetical protein